MYVGRVCGMFTMWRVHLHGVFTTCRGDRHVCGVCVAMCMARSLRGVFICVWCSPGVWQVHGLRKVFITCVGCLLWWA